MYNRKSNNSFWQTIALNMHEVMSIEISRGYKFYIPQQKKIFRDALDLYLELLAEFNFFYFNTIKNLFVLLKNLNIKLLIKIMIDKRYGKNCIFLNLNQEENNQL